MTTCSFKQASPLRTTSGSRSSPPPESDQIHDKYGVIASVVGKVQPGSTGFGKTGGAAVYHQHKTPKQASEFGKFIGAFLTGPDAPPSLDISKGFYFNYGGIVADVVYPDKIPKA